jgi:hypothetical protein
VPTMVLVTVTALGVTVETVTTVDVIPNHEDTVESRAAPLQDAAYAGILPAVGGLVGAAVVGVLTGEP